MNAFAAALGEPSPLTTNTARPRVGERASFRQTLASDNAQSFPPPHTFDFRAPPTGQPSGAGGNTKAKQQGKQCYKKNTKRHKTWVGDVGDQGGLSLNVLSLSPPPIIHSELRTNTIHLLLSQAALLTCSKQSAHLSLLDSTSAGGGAWPSHRMDTSKPASAVTDCLGPHSHRCDGPPPEPHELAGRAYQTWHSAAARPNQLDQKVDGLAAEALPSPPNIRSEGYQ